MIANEIRKKFLDFFALKGHRIVESDSLVPKDDPTVLFTTAGMQQFKRQFLGQIDDYTKAATCQKCLRTDDLDVVGKTSFHHTFFEMLGNFSFGDYFKKEAILWAWEFLTKELRIPADKLWVSVYKDDDEAYGIWRDTVKLPVQKIVKLGDKSNFWPSNAKENGPNGPCGPCSEIFFDYGVNPNCPKGAKCDPDCNCGRFSEVWNLVFTQFNRKEGGVLEPLPAKNIDTGMGFERLVAVVQGKKNNYETDIFRPIFAAIERHIVGAKASQLAPVEKNIVADHLRAIVFGISDGVVPSNEGRGYVIRKLIVKITDHVVDLGIKTPVIHKLVPSIVEAMGSVYPEIISKTDEISRTIERVEQSYIRIRAEKMPEFIEQAKKIQSKDIAEDQKYKDIGDLLFLFKDTHGLSYESMFPQLTTLGILPSDDEKCKMVVAFFDQRMNEQKDRSRAASKMTGDVFANAQLNLNVPKTEFLGYDEKNYRSSGKILKLFVNNQEVSEVNEGEDVKMILDRTPFYAEGGGQVGDTGKIWNGNSLFRVSDTQKIADIFIHFGTVVSGSFNSDDTVETEIDRERRISIMRNHTATHLLQSALREVLGSHVQQQGSLVAADRLRFDFTHNQPIPKEKLERIEDIINRHIGSNDPIQKNTMSLREAKEKGALAFFAEKYKDTVRVVAVGNYSKELCGGTHLEATGQIGQFKITNESSIAQGIRRLEARTGTGALEFIREQEKTEAERLAAQQKRTQELEIKREMANSLLESVKNSADTIINNSETIQNTKIITSVFKDAEVDVLRKISDLLKSKANSAVIILASKDSESAFVLLSVTDDLVKKNIKANDLIKEIARLMDGSGGGRPELAQAGTKDASKVEAAIKETSRLIKEKLSS